MVPKLAWAFSESTHYRLALPFRREVADLPSHSVRCHQPAHSSRRKAPRQSRSRLAAHFHPRARWRPEGTRRWWARPTREWAGQTRPRAADDRTTVKNPTPPKALHEPPMPLDSWSDCLPVQEHHGDWERTHILPVDRSIPTVDVKVVGVASGPSFGARRRENGFRERPREPRQRRSREWQERQQTTWRSMQSNMGFPPRVCVEVCMFGDSRSGSLIHPTPPLLFTSTCFSLLAVSGG